eukprot:3450882-Pyramimonas_sp.AAC.1
MSIDPLAWAPTLRTALLDDLGPVGPKLGKDAAPGVYGVISRVGSRISSFQIVFVGNCAAPLMGERYGGPLEACE